MKNLNYFELISVSGGCSGRVGELLGCYYARFRNWLDDRSADKMIELIDDNGGAMAGYSA